MRFTLLTLLAISAFGAYAADSDFIFVDGHEEIYGHRWVNIPVSEEAKVSQANFLREDMFHVYKMSPEAEVFSKALSVRERFRFIFNANEHAKNGDFGADRQKLADAIEFAHVYADKMMIYANDIPAKFPKHDALLLEAKSAYKVLRMGMSAWNRIEEQNFKHQPPSLASIKFQNCESGAFFSGLFDSKSQRERIQECNEAKSLRDLSDQVSLSSGTVCHYEESPDAMDRCQSYYKRMIKQIDAAAAPAEARVTKASLEVEAGR